MLVLIHKPFGMSVFLQEVLGENQSLQQEARVKNTRSEQLQLRVRELESKLAEFELLQAQLRSKSAALERLQQQVRDLETELAVLQDGSNSGSQQASLTAENIKAKDAKVHKTCYRVKTCYFYPRHY